MTGDAAECAWFVARALAEYGAAVMTGTAPEVCVSHFWTRLLKDLPAVTRRAWQEAWRERREARKRHRNRLLDAMRESMYQLRLPLTEA